MKNHAETVNWSKLPSITDYKRARLMQLPPKKSVSEEKAKALEQATEIKNHPKPQSPKSEH